MNGSFERPHDVACPCIGIVWPRRLVVGKGQNEPGRSLCALIAGPRRKLGQGSASAPRSEATEANQASGLDVVLRVHGVDENWLFYFPGKSLAVSCSNDAFGS